MGKCVSVSIQCYSTPSIPPFLFVCGLVHRERRRKLSKDKVHTDNQLLQVFVWFKKVRSASSTLVALRRLTTAVVLFCTPVILFKMKAKPRTHMDSVEQQINL